MSAPTPAPATREVREGVEFADNDPHGFAGISARQGAHAGGGSERTAAEAGWTQRVSLVRRCGSDRWDRNRTERHKAVRTDNSARIPRSIPRDIWTQTPAEVLPRTAAGVLSCPFVFARELRRQRACPRD